MQRILVPTSSLVGWVVLCILCLRCHAPRIEADLAERGRRQLAEAGLAPGQLTVDGRDATLAGSAESEEQRRQAAELVAGVTGVRVVRNRLTLGDSVAAASTSSAGADSDPSISTTEAGASGAKTGATAGDVPGSGASSGTDPASGGGGAVTEAVTAAAGRSSGGASEVGELQTSLDAALRDRRVEFATNSAQLTARGHAVLDEIYDVLVAHPRARIAISGHTDLKGRGQFNLDLSRRRAGAARDYLVARGLAEERFITAGYGSHRPIADNDTEEGRQRNRRIEFQVLESSP